jgi:hypothetical protein
MTPERINEIKNILYGYIGECVSHDLLQKIFNDCHPECENVVFDPSTNAVIVFTKDGTEFILRDWNCYVMTPELLYKESGVL